MTDFWLGPYGMRVDNDVCEVPSTDGVNRVLREGGETEIGGGRFQLMSAAEYFSRYAEKRASDDRFWYKAAPAEKGHPFTDKEITIDDIRKQIAK
jgi:hypothetical protein